MSHSECCIVNMMPTDIDMITEVQGLHEEVKEEKIYILSTIRDAAEALLAAMLDPPGVAAGGQQRHGNALRGASAFVVRRRGAANQPHGAHKFGQAVIR